MIQFDLRIVFKMGGENHQRVLIWKESIRIYSPEVPNMTIAGKSPLFNSKYIDSFRVDFPAIVMLGTSGGGWYIQWLFLVPLKGGR